jgi:hypothetical protein
MTIEGMGPFQLEKHTPPKWVYQKYKTWNTYIEPPKPQSPIKTHRAQSSIDKKPIPPKEIDSQAYCPIKGL